MNKTEIVLGGGCFWCTEAVFLMLRGIISVVPGYAGGTKENPNYEEVSYGLTGHAETVKVEYDSDMISLNDILTVFFATHDPTTKNRQGNDIGEQYRSIILYATKDQQKDSKKFIDDLNKSSEQGKPIVTQLKKLDKFYPAENYHKNYYANNQKESYCQIVINPKLKKVQEKFAELLKK